MKTDLDFQELFHLINNVLDLKLKKNLSVFKLESLKVHTFLHKTLVTTVGFNADLNSSLEWFQQNVTHTIVLQKRFWAITFYHFRAIKMTLTF